MKFTKVLAKMHQNWINMTFEQKKPYINKLNSSQLAEFEFYAQKQMPSYMKKNPEKSPKEAQEELYKE